MKLNFQELNFVKNATNNISSSELSADDVIEVIEIQERIDKKIDNVLKAQRKIMKSYDVKPNKNGIYDFSDHKKQKEIAKKINELSAKKHTIESNLKSSKSDFIKALTSSKQLTISQIRGLAKLFTNEKN